MDKARSCRLRYGEGRFAGFRQIRIDAWNRIVGSGGRGKFPFFTVVIFAFIALIAFIVVIIILIPKIRIVYHPRITIVVSKGSLYPRPG
jgi:hypothetical protein